MKYVARFLVALVVVVVQRFCPLISGCWSQPHGSSKMNAAIRRKPALAAVPMRTGASRPMSLARRSAVRNYTSRFRRPSTTPGTIACRWR